ncbi:MAG: helix-turn-helix transcriptional regulator [Nitrospirota bacterium]
MNENLDTIRSLSEREKEVLTWSKRGKSSWEISAILNISERTVNFHINNIMQKLNAVSRTQAVAVAIERGLIKKD